MVVTTGFFDGVHLGHRQVINTLVASARERGEESCVITFWPHPRIALHNGAGDLRLLSTFKEKERMILSLGVDKVEVLEFTREFAKLSARQYLQDYVKERFGADALVVGYDNRMGSDGKGLDGISEMAAELRLEVIPVGCCHPDALLKPVSSTCIRAALEKGDVVSAADMLGYRYSLEGTIVPGKSLGHTIGFPTANISVDDPLKFIPAQGAYFVEAQLGDEKIFGMANVGNSLEVNLFNFDRKIYGSVLKISFIRKIRNEIKFNSLSLLKEQLEKDRICCKEWISGM